MYVRKQIFTQFIKLLSDYLFIKSAAMYFIKSVNFCNVSLYNECQQQMNNREEKTRLSVAEHGQEI